MTAVSLPTRAAGRLQLMLLGSEWARGRGRRDTESTTAALK